MGNKRKRPLGQPTGKIPQYTESSSVKGTQYSKKDRERLYPCVECGSFNTRIGISGNNLKCMNCGVISKFEEDVTDREAIWDDLLKIDDDRDKI